jgi:hypothetical protein
MAKKAAGKSKKTAGARKKRAAGKAKTAASETSDSPIWTPSKFALWSQRWIDPNDASPTTVLLHHPTAPFPDDPVVVDEIDDSTVDSTIQQLGFDYLTVVSELPQIDPPLDLPQTWRDQLNPNHAPPVEERTFRWLPSGADPDNPDPFVSFRVIRGSSAKPLDQTIILLASEWRSDAYLGSEFGIRVVAHARQRSDEKFEVHITGMSASLPFARYRTAGVSTRRWRSQRAFKIASESAPTVKAEMAKTLGLENDSVRIRGLRLAQIDDDTTAEIDDDKIEETTQVERRCTGKAKTTGDRTDATHYSFVFVGTPRNAGALVSKVELVADAMPPVGRARIFARDPTSQGRRQNIRTRRRTRSEQELDNYRIYVQITAGQIDPLQYPLPSGTDMKVLVCPGFVLEDRKPPILPGDTKRADLPGTGPAIRSNDLSAVMAFWNVAQFFKRLEAYGLPPNDYFRIAGLPLKLFYRSGIRPGPGKDGQAVNARVLVEGWKVDFEGPTAPGQRPMLQMHLALADLSTRARKPWDGKDRSPAEPLGIAADERWIWHEIGHVLLMASVGELQFRFCHSPGDALAAIVADPQSKLATDANWRGATFPWVFIPRRHDRCVSHGWSWGGAMHYAMSQVPRTQAPRRKGYWTEQILSSSLFRMYRSIGGDTTLVGLSDQPDIARRESASHYSVYLIMRGIQILGPSDIVPAHEPDQLVSALIDADKGTQTWDVTFPPIGYPLPLGETRFQFHRVGGCVHKVIRWAFEAQGLYRSSNNEPGFPPPVDVYIQDLRPDPGAISYGPGSYIPVSLHCDDAQGQGDVPPEWQADPNAIIVAPGTGEITVKVGNRGTELAQDVEVSLWWHEWPAGPPPDWDASWTQCALSGSAAVDVQDVDPTDPADLTTLETFGPFAAVPLAAGTRYLLLAQATCGADRANVDPATLLPCSQEPTPLVDVVANDNNLGLRVFGPAPAP